MNTEERHPLGPQLLPNLGGTFLPKKQLVKQAKDICNSEFSPAITIGKGLKAEKVFFPHFDIAFFSIWCVVTMSGHSQ